MNDLGRTLLNRNRTKAAPPPPVPTSTVPTTTVERPTEPEPLEYAVRRRFLRDRVLWSCGGLLFGFFLNVVCMWFQQDRLFLVPILCVSLMAVTTACNSRSANPTLKIQGLLEAVFFTGGLVLSMPLTVMLATLATTNNAQ